MFNISLLIKSFVGIKLIIYTCPKFSMYSSIKFRDFFKKKMSIQSAKQRTINDIKNDDVRIQITGYIKDLVEKEHFILDDSTGQINVDIKNLDFKNKKNDLINVIGELVISMDGGKTIVAEIIQDMNKLNFEYYLKLYELKKEYK